MSEVAERLAAVARARWERNRPRAGRRAEDVRLIAVSKTFPIGAVREAYDAGQREFGENKVPGSPAEDRGCGRRANQVAPDRPFAVEQGAEGRGAAEAGVPADRNSLDLAAAEWTMWRPASKAGQVRGCWIQVDLALESRPSTAPRVGCHRLFGWRPRMGMRGGRSSPGLMLLPPAVGKFTEEAIGRCRCRFVGWCCWWLHVRREGAAGHNAGRPRRRSAARSPRTCSACPLRTTPASDRATRPARSPAARAAPGSPLTDRGSEIAQQCGRLGQDGVGGLRGVRTVGSRSKRHGR